MFMYHIKLVQENINKNFGYSFKKIKEKMGSTDEWSIPCLDANDELEPSPEELDSMYQKLSAGETIQLTWKCTGRRLPTPVQANDNEAKNKSNTVQ